MSANIVEVTEANFEQEVLMADEPVVVDFWAAWCGPCRMMAPVFEELAGEYNGKAKFAKVDVDANPQLAGRYGIMSIPTIVVFRDGQPVEQVIGFRGKAHLEQLIQKVTG